MPSNRGVNTKPALGKTQRSTAPVLLPAPAPALGLSFLLGAAVQPVRILALELPAVAFKAKAGMCTHEKIMVGMVLLLAVGFVAGKAFSLF